MMMKYVKQILVILLITSIGEFLNIFLPFPISGFIYGMALLFISLCLGVVKLDQIDETARFLLNVMPILFIPSAVGIMEKWSELQHIWWQIIIIIILTTVFVMAVSGLVTQAIIKRDRGQNEK